MSYSSEGKWHAANLLPAGLDVDKLHFKVVLPWGSGHVSRSPLRKDRNHNRNKAAEKPHPINVQLGQAVGISIKHGYGKFIFEAKVAALEPSPGPTSGGIIVLSMPEKIECVQRRSYFRVNVPETLKVNVTLWHRRCSERQAAPGRRWKGRLIDISAGGLQLAVDAEQKPDFKKGQFISLKFTPMPYEAPLMFDAQIRKILPTVDKKSICFGVQMVGLEASREGREVLARIIGIIEWYDQLIQSSLKQQDFQITSSQTNAAFSN